MTVQELIDYLEKIEDKDMPLMVLEDNCDGLTNVDFDPDHHISEDIYGGAPWWAHIEPKHPTKVGTKCLLFLLW